MLEDINNKEMDENQLWESEHRFRVLAESSMVGVYILQEMQFKYLNPKFCKMLEYSEEELLNGVNPFDLVHPDDLEKLEELKIEWEKRELNNFDVEFRAITKANKVVNLQVFGSRIQIDGESALIGVVVDDTDHKVAIENFKMSLESYKTLFDSIGDAIYIQDKDGRFLEVNDGASDMYGYDKSFFIGKYPEVLAAPGKVDMAQLEEYFEKALDGEPQRFSWWGRKKNGENFPKEIKLNPGFYFGEKVVIAIARDVTDQYYHQEKIKESEEMFKQLFMNSPIGIAMLNEHQEIELINNGFEKIFGYSQGEIAGLDINKLVIPEGKEDEAMNLSDQQESFQILTKRIDKDKRFVDVLIYGVPVIVEGKTISFYRLYVDITDRKKAEDQIKQSLKEKEVLLAEIHHRVKNNLAVITGLLELQGYNTENEGAKEALKDSQMRINSMALIHEKLYQSENLSEIQFDIYIEELLEVISRSHQSKENPVTIKINAEPIPLTITQAIPCGLLLNEIVTNSMKHAFPDTDGGLIEITFNKNGGKLYFSVSDDGIGLPDNFNEVKKKSLGMTLINTLSKQLEAEMEIDSRNGTRYTLIFNYHEVKVDASEL